ncbi:MAG: J domain-containing protein [Oscillospiraceae bacterium]|nr:J domain-containing protein [Oscillospiraceae bacterium]
MSNLLESYRVLGVKVGAGMADVTTSYRQLCRIHHPDISDEPDAEELMKQINIAYTVLREKFKRESAFRDRQTYSRPVRRYQPPPSYRQQSEEKWQTGEKSQTEEEAQEQAQEQAQKQAAEAQQRRAAERAAASADAEKEAYAVLHDYFAALNTFDYTGAYNYLSNHDKKHIPLDSFTEWRESVARLYPMREFKIAGGSSIAVVTWGDDCTFHARKFRIIITEDSHVEDGAQSGDIDKLVINENGRWGVFLGYREINELTRTFDKRFEKKKKRDVEKQWEEFYAGQHPEYSMFNIQGMRKPVTTELYRLRRYGGSMTFAAISITNDDKNAGYDEMLRSAAKTITGTLREIDISAYAGDGVFAILFVELGKKNAESIICRMIECIRNNAGLQLSEKVEIKYEYDSWTGNGYAELDNVNDILKKFNKNM